MVGLCVSMSFGRIWAWCCVSISIGFVWWNPKKFFDAVWRKMINWWVLDIIHFACQISNDLMNIKRCHPFKSLTWLPGEQECVPPRTQPKVDCSLGGRSPGWWASWPRPRRSWGRPRPGWGRPRPRPCRRTARSSRSRAAGAGTVPKQSGPVKRFHQVCFRGSPEITPNWWKNYWFAYRARCYRKALWLCPPPWTVTTVTPLIELA